jgi:hypothetical protein
MTVSSVGIIQIIIVPRVCNPILAQQIRSEVLTFFSGLGQVFLQLITCGNEHEILAKAENIISNFIFVRRSSLSIA